MALYRLYRGVDARDVAQAFGQALTADCARFEAINISGPTPFLEEDCVRLRAEPEVVLRLREPDLVEEFSRRNWQLPTSIDRVYAIDKARALLGYAPHFGYREFLAEMEQPTSPGSER
jgi:nucleoside-diphosphate-sugar epimerase